jgi:murein DD-endopeptidase MepM/ murein hydrolase activator NlpD
MQFGGSFNNKMRSHNRTDEIVITVKVIGVMALAIGFGLILTQGRYFNKDEDTNDTPTVNSMLAGEVSQSPTVVVQDVTATETVILTPITDNTQGIPTGESTEISQATVTPTATGTLVTPLPTMTFTVFPVTPTDTLTPTEVPPCEPIDDWVTYNVQSGDTLNDLSVEFQTSIESLQRGNCLTKLDLEDGQILYVPPLRDEPAVFSPAQPQGCDDPKIRIISPIVGETVTDGWEIVGVVDPSDFGFYRVQIRRDTTEQVYETLFESDQRVGEGNRIGFLNFRSSDNDGSYWVRLQVYDSTGQDAGRCAVCVSFGKNSGKCKKLEETRSITTVARSVPNNNNVGKYNSGGSSLRGCSATEAEGGFPTQNPLGSGFYIVRQEFTQIHSGIDLSATTNTPVLAAGSGTVVFAGWSNLGYGNTIVIAHGTTFTLYGHLNSIGVSCGQAVTTGQSIGAVGTTGRSSGPHLHFEVRDASDVPQNPRDYLDFSACLGGWCN